MAIINFNRAKSKYLSFLKSSSDCRPACTLQDVFGNMTLNLDKIDKRLIVSESSNPLNRTLVIHLNGSMVISIKKVYRDQGRKMNGSNPNNRLEFIHLQFSFSDCRKSLLLTLFDRRVTALNEIEILERRAILWQMLLSKLTLQR